MPEESKSAGWIREIEGRVEARCELLRRSGRDLAAGVTDVGIQASRLLKAGHVIYTMGNGGSAAQAQHLAAELVGRFVGERPALRSLAFTADSAVVTAIGNDYGFEKVFERQVQAHVRPGDMVICFSTSGKSQNVVRAAQEARRRGALVVGFIGGTGGDLVRDVDTAVVVPTTDTAQIQEVHLMLCHLLCSVIDGAPGNGCGS